MLGNCNKRGKPSERSCFWNNVVMDPNMEPESTFAFITRVAKHEDNRVLQLPTVEQPRRRKSPSNCFLSRHKELARKRQRTMNLHNNSIQFKTEGESSIPFLSTMGNNFTLKNMLTAEKASEAEEAMNGRQGGQTME